MLYRRFGKTGLSLSVLTCGGMRFQHSWKKEARPTRKSLRRVEAVVQRALEVGINHFETAYGYGTSEEELGRVLSGVPREAYYIQTKITPKASSEEFRRRFDESQRLLRVDTIDLFSIHGINNREIWEYTFRRGGCLDVALQLKEEGRIRHLGFSTHAPTSLILEAIQTGVFEYVNLHWYYIFQDNWPAIEAAAHRDMGVLIISPNDKGGLLYRPSEKLRRLVAPLSPMVFNDLFCLSRPEVHTLSIGAARPEDFDEHLRALDLYDRWEELLPPILERLEAAQREALGEDWLQTWREGLPSWEETPGGVNLPVILFLWNLVQAFDLLEYARMRYNLLGNGSHWFPGNPLTAASLEDLARALSRSPHRERILEMIPQIHRTLAGRRRRRLGAASS